MCDQFQGRALTLNKQCITPNLDELCQRGVHFKNAYTPNAVCSPARASLMTGLLPHNHGVLYVNHCVDEDQGNLRTQYPHWGQRLNDAGYYTGYFGRWHVDRNYSPKDFGWKVDCFDETEEFRKINSEIMARKGSIEKIKSKYINMPEGYTNELLYAVVDEEADKRYVGVATEMALEFLKECNGKTEPWCCYVGITEPHDPYICSKSSYDLYNVDEIVLPENIEDEMNDKPGLYRKVAEAFAGMTQREKKEAMACYFATITDVDKQVGRLISHLKETNQYDNTIIIFTSDHGDFVGAHGLYCKNVSAFEEAYNIPLIMAGPGIPKDFVSSARVGLHDLCPTLCDLTGSQPIINTDSRSFKPLLDDVSKEKDYTLGYAEYHGSRILLTQRVLWDGDWKFVFNAFDYSELYNLKDDPYELNNLIKCKEYEDIVKKMTKKVWDILKDTNDHSLYNSNYKIIRVAPYGRDI